MLTKSYLFFFKKTQKFQKTSKYKNIKMFKNFKKPQNFSKSENLFFQNLEISKKITWGHALKKISKLFKNELRNIKKYLCFLFCRIVCSCLRHNLEILFKFWRNWYPRIPSESVDSFVGV